MEFFSKINNINMYIIELYCWKDPFLNESPYEILYTFVGENPLRVSLKMKAKTLKNDKNVTKDSINLELDNMCLTWRKKKYCYMIKVIKLKKTFTYSEIKNF